MFTYDTSVYLLLSANACLAIRIGLSTKTQNAVNIHANLGERKNDQSSIFSLHKRFLTLSGHADWEITVQKKCICQQIDLSFSS